ncbi:DNA polymerase family A-domain-containing protein [Gigaspora rosea]|uniref:DNA-directed DNA polymerase n=1 Tax=Gigaspora rosea TaxID=44941 RepID=A0A397ULE1_9GLOM|nr:DNA polymerase family A-domain-containing protein [Gigaspora rosea]
MLPNWLYKQVFPRNNRMRPSKNRIRIALDHLKQHGLLGKEKEKFPPLTPFRLPKLCGNTIAEHFWNIGEKQARPCRDLAKAFANSELPDIPSEKIWEFKSGWTRYEKGKQPESIDFPKDDILCFDIETLLEDSDYALIACAASTKAWYAWISPRLTKYRGVGHLIPMGNVGRDRVIIGHNVGFDRARIKEEYHRDRSCNNYIDTMSLHIAVSGLCTQQRPTWIKYDKATEENNEDYLERSKDFQAIYDVSSINNLRNVYKFHCQGELDKSSRNYFINGSLDEIVKPEIFQKLVSYCADDVFATHSVFKKVFPRFLEVCPHPVSFAGIISMGNMFLTTSKDWDHYIEKAESVYQEQSNSIEKSLQDLALAAVKSWKDDPQSIINNPWLRQLDWSTPSPRAKKLKGYPQWYRNIYNARTESLKITPRTRIVPLLLRLKWQGYPLYYSKKHGWMYRVPKNDEKYRTNAKPCRFDKPMPPTEQYANDIGGIYYRIPHKDGEDSRCATPLSKQYITAFEKGILTSEYKEAKAALKMNATCSYWISSRERIKGQMVVYNDHLEIQDMGFQSESEKGIGMILPQTLTMGTITRRAVEKTWMTASNAKESRIGSELKTNIQAPKGYKIVGADVDSEELWIASLIGDSQFGFHGATALGWMTIQGTKAAGTDLHSRTAKILKISRSDAKVFNYGRIYGAGLKFAAKLLRQFNENIEESEAVERVTELYSQTKGKKFFIKNINPNDFPRKTFWYGGSESYMFNRLEEIATAETPRTPVLKCGITDALKRKVVDENYMTSRINWVIQSSGVDYLHLLLVSMQYLLKKYKIDARFMLSVHDEVRFLVKESDTYRAALALQISNLWTRTLFSYMLGIKDLPLSVSFFSAVDIDHVLRKEVEMNCKTLSNNIEIEKGRSLTIHELLKYQRSLQFDKTSQDNCNDNDIQEPNLPNDLLIPYSISDKWLNYF